MSADLSTFRGNSLVDVIGVFDLRSVMQADAKVKKYNRI